MRALAYPALGAVLTGLLLTGCGALGGDDGDGGGAAETKDGEQSMEEAMLDFAACMRDNGVDMPDPEGDGGAIALPAIDPEDEEAMAASKECEELLPVDEDAPSEEEAFQESLEMAECMRENGLDVPDPEPGQGLALPVEPGDDEGMEIVTECSGAEAGGGSMSVQGGDE